MSTSSAFPLGRPPSQRGVTLIDFNLSLVLFIGFRVSVRALRERFSVGPASSVGVVERIAVVGAGMAAMSAPFGAVGVSLLAVVALGLYAAVTGRDPS